MDNSRFKFRAWDKQNKRMLTLCRLGLRGFSHETWSPSPISNEPYSNDTLKIMQFTGLKDKKGKEIYEGDIVKFYGYEVRNGKQIRPERIFAINDFIKDAYRLLCITEGTGETIEVIGNIYKNPELL